MKKLLYIALIALAGMSTSCQDTLDLKSSDKVESKNYWRDKNDAEGAMASAYSMLECANDFYAFAEVRWTVEAYREDMVDLGGDAVNYLNWTELYNFTYSNSNTQFSKYWSANYTGINRANQIIANLPKIPSDKIKDTEKEQLMAEAKFLRAYYHMKLLLNWEKIIIRNSEIVVEADLSKDVSTREATWDFIIKDLQDATVLVSKRTDETIGRATKGAAYSYLGFAYLTRAYEEKAKKDEHLQNAVNALKQVTGYSLVKDYLSMFNGTNKNSPESIFEMQFTKSFNNKANYQTSLHQWIAASELGGWDEILPNKMLVDEFKKEGKISATGNYDSRLYATIFFQDPYFNDGKGKVYGTEYDSTFCDFTDSGIAKPGTSYDKPVFRKYLPTRKVDITDNWQTDVNVPLMRYSNVLLMLAEAYNEQGHPELATPLINQVRERADMPAMTGTTQADVRAQIEHERIIEFPLENFRFYDLRRWGKAKAALTAVGRDGYSENKNAFFPIPQKEIFANNAISK
jgi:hypothetical protein